MIHLFIWLSAVAGVSFAAFLYLVLAGFLYAAGQIGRILGLALAVGSVLWWVAPGFMWTALALFGVGLLIVGVVVAAVWLIRRAVPTRIDTYERAVRTARDTGDRSALDAWWGSGGVLDRWAEKLPAWLRLGDGIDWDQAATTMPRPPGEQR